MGDGDMVIVREPTQSFCDADTISRKLKLENVDFVAKGGVDARAQIRCAYVALDPIGLPVKPAFPPAGKIERGFAQGL